MALADVPQIAGRAIGGIGLSGLPEGMSAVRRVLVVLAVTAIAVSGCGLRYASVCEMISPDEIESLLGRPPSDRGPMAGVAGCSWSRPSDEPLVPYIVWVSVVPLEPDDQPLPTDRFSQSLRGLDYPAALSPGFGLTLVTGNRSVKVEWNAGALGDLQREQSVLAPFAELLVRRVPELVLMEPSPGRR